MSSGRPVGSGCCAHGPTAITRMSLGNPGRVICPLDGPETSRPTRRIGTASSSVIVLANAALLLPRLLGLLLRLLLSGAAAEPQRRTAPDQQQDAQADGSHEQPLLPATRLRLLRGAGALRGSCAGPLRRRRLRRGARVGSRAGRRG